jgi:hypothetical protein
MLEVGLTGVTVQAKIALEDGQMYFQSYLKEVYIENRMEELIESEALLVCKIFLCRYLWFIFLLCLL